MYHCSSPARIRRWSCPPPSWRRRQPRRRRWPIPRGSLGSPCTSGPRSPWDPNQRNWYVSLFLLNLGWPGRRAGIWPREIGVLGWFLGGTDWYSTPRNWCVGLVLVNLMMAAGQEGWESTPRNWEQIYKMHVSFLGIFERSAGLFKPSHPTPQVEVCGGCVMRERRRAMKSGRRPSNDGPQVSIVI
jgi:hypothetical protein